MRLLSGKPREICSMSFRTHTCALEQGPVSPIHAILGVCAWPSFLADVRIPRIVGQKGIYPIRPVRADAERNQLALDLGTWHCIDARLDESDGGKAPNADWHRSAQEPAAPSGVGKLPAPAASAPQAAGCDCPVRDGSTATRRPHQGRPLPYCARTVPQHADHSRPWP